MHRATWIATYTSHSETLKTEKHNGHVTGNVTLVHQVLTCLKNNNHRLLDFGVAKTTLSFGRDLKSVRKVGSLKWSGSEWRTSTLWVMMEPLQRTPPPIEPSFDAVLRINFCFLKIIFDRKK